MVGAYSPQPESKSVCKTIFINVCLSKLFLTYYRSEFHIISSQKIDNSGLVGYVSQLNLLEIAK